MKWWSLKLNSKRSIFLISALINRNVSGFDKHKWVYITYLLIYLIKLQFRLPSYYQKITFSYPFVSDLNSFEHRKAINYTSQAHYSFQPSYYYYMGAKYNITHKLTMIIKCQIRFCARVNYCYPSDYIILALCVMYTKDAIVIVFFIF